MTEISFKYAWWCFDKARNLLIIAKVRRLTQSEEEALDEYQYIFTEWVKQLEKKEEYDELKKILGEP